MIMWWTNEYWASEDGTVRYPARGEMNHNHIRNTMNFIVRRMPRYFERWGRRLGYPEEEAFERMICSSPVWRALEAGLELPDPGEYPDQPDTLRRRTSDPSYGVEIGYTLEQYRAYNEWATRRVNNG